MSGHMSGCYQINEGSMASTSELQKAGLLGSDFAMEPRKGESYRLCCRYDPSYLRPWREDAARPFGSSPFPKGIYRGVGKTKT